MGNKLADLPTVMTVVAGALVSPDGAILMHQRRFGSVHGGLWEFPGGKVEPGESPESALSRELEEELGIRIDGDFLIETGFAAEHFATDGSRLPIVILLYSCRRWQGVPKCLEGEAIGWFAPSDLSQLEMPPLDVPLATRLCSLLEIGLI